MQAGGITAMTAGFTASAGIGAARNAAHGTVCGLLFLRGPNEFSAFSHYSINSPVCSLGNPRPAIYLALTFNPRKESHMKALVSFLVLGCALPLVCWADAVNINTADARTIAKELKGIGVARAQAIVAYRNEHGPFKTADDLARVKGIA